MSDESIDLGIMGKRGRRAFLDSNDSFKKNLKIILSKTKKNGECLDWTGAFVNGDKHKRWPYPEIKFGQRRWTGNRLCLALITGKNPKHLLALHTCDNTKCLNPKHLYWGTPMDNTNDQIKRQRSKKFTIKACPYGHKYEGANLKITNKGQRVCRSCRWYSNHGLPKSREYKLTTRKYNRR